MSYRNISNWPAARIFRQSKHLGGEIGILKDVTLSVWMPQAKYILRLARAHHTIVRLAGAVGMRWTTGTRQRGDAGHERLASIRKRRVIIWEAIWRDNAVMPRSMSASIGSTKAPMAVCPTATN